MPKRTDKRSTCPLTSILLQYRAQDAPWFTLGHGIVLIYICLCLLTSLVYYLTLKAENVRRDLGLGDEIIDGVNDKGISIFSYIRGHAIG
jgi:hypothetical protein